MEKTPNSIEHLRKILVDSEEHQSLANKIGFANHWKESERQSCIHGLQQMIEENIGESSFIYTSNRGADAFYLEKVCSMKLIINDWAYVFKDTADEDLTFFANTNAFLMNILNRTQICDLTKLEFRVNTSNPENESYNILSQSKENLDKIVKVCDFTRNMVSYDADLVQALDTISQQAKSIQDQIDTYIAQKLIKASENNQNQDTDDIQADLLFLKEFKNFSRLDATQKEIQKEEIDAELDFFEQTITTNIKENGFFNLNSINAFTDYLNGILDYLFYLKDTETELNDLKSRIVRLRGIINDTTFMTPDHMLQTNDEQKKYIEEVAFLFLLNCIEHITSMMPTYSEMPEISTEMQKFYDHHAQLCETLLQQLKDGNILVFKNFPTEMGPPNTFGTYEDFLQDAQKHYQANHTDETDTHDQTDNTTDETSH